MLSAQWSYLYLYNKHLILRYMVIGKFRSYPILNKSNRIGFSFSLFISYNFIYVINTLIYIIYSSSHLIYFLLLMLLLFIFKYRMIDGFWFITGISMNFV